MPDLLVFSFISLIAIISPGPDFALLLRNALYSRTTGFYTTVGIALGLLVHLTYILMGLSIAVSTAPFLFYCIKYVGAAYLFYLGVSSFKKQPVTEKKEDGAPIISAQSALRQGFLTNLLNPKAVLFLTSLFSQFLSPATPVWARVEYGFINFTLSICWFLALTILLTHPTVGQKIYRVRIYLTRTMGVFLILLSFKFFFT